MEFLILIPIAFFTFIIFMTLSLAGATSICHNLCDELLDFQYHNPGKGYVWSTQVEEWRTKNGLQVYPIYDFYGWRHPFNVFRKKYCLIPDDGLGQEFRKFIKDRKAAKSVEKEEAKKILRIQKENAKKGA